MMKDMFVHASNFDSQEKNENELYVPVNILLKIQKWMIAMIVCPSNSSK